MNLPVSTLGNNHMRECCGEAYVELGIPLGAFLQVDLLALPVLAVAGEHRGGGVVGIGAAGNVAEGGGAGGLEGGSSGDC